MKKIFYLLLISTYLIYPQDADWNKSENETAPKDKVKEFQYLAYFFTQGVFSNFYAENELLKGQIVGRLFSSNTTRTGQQTFYFEQRILPFFIYQPKLLDGKAILRASFEIDWTWGDASYGVGGNYGSAFSADQVNLQTQNIELELLPAKGWAVNLGLQRLFDTPYNPYRTAVGTMTNTAYRLMFWGSDAVGVSVRNDGDYYRWKAGYYQLYENNVQQMDDVTLWEFNYENDLTPNLRNGFSFWYVNDRGNGEGGVSILGQGLNSVLNDYNGTFKFDLNGLPYKADIFWLGTYLNSNAEFNLGRWSLNGFLVSNFGTVRHDKNDWEKAADILGFAANIRAGYKYGQTAQDIATIDLMLATGDQNNISDQKYSGVITGNTWGSPGALLISSGAYILFPHGNVVNRFISAVSDISNMGLGLIGGTVNLHKDFIPNALNVKVGGGVAFSQYKPAGGGQLIGSEINARISWTPEVFMNIELHGAYMFLGDFYESSSVNGNSPVKPANPFTLFTTFKWLMF